MVSCFGSPDKAYLWCPNFFPFALSLERSFRNYNSYMTDWFDWFKIKEMKQFVIADNLSELSFFLLDQSRIHIFKTTLPCGLKLSKMVPKLQKLQNILKNTSLQKFGPIMLLTGWVLHILVRLCCTFVILSFPYSNTICK